MRTSIIILTIVLLATAVFSVACSSSQPQAAGTANTSASAAPLVPSGGPGTPNTAGDALDANFDNYQQSSLSATTGSAADQGPSDQDLAMIG